MQKKNSMRAILIIDDSLPGREGLRILLDREFPSVMVAEATNGEAIKLELAARCWDLIILDVSHPTSHRLLLLYEIHRICSGTPVLVISSQPDSRDAMLARDLGAAGYSGKDGPALDLCRAIREASRQNHPACTDVCLQGASAPDGRLKRLSPREYRIMLALGTGTRPTDIAAEMSLSIKTVSTYKRRILDKLQLKTTVDLMRHVMHNRLS